MPNYEIPAQALADTEPIMAAIVCWNCPHREVCDNPELCKRAQAVQDAVLGKED
jgi:hypothetical protein